MLLLSNFSHWYWFFQDILFDLSVWQGQQATMSPISFMGINFYYCISWCHYLYENRIHTDHARWNTIAVPSGRESCPGCVFQLSQTNYMHSFWGQIILLLSSYYIKPDELPWWQSSNGQNNSKIIPQQHNTKQFQFLQTIWDNGKNILKVHYLKYLDKQIVKSKPPLTRIPLLKIFKISIWTKIGVCMRVYWKKHQLIWFYNNQRGSGGKKRKISTVVK